jgi:hypothetical protein
MNQIVANVIHNMRFTTTRNVLMGAGIAYTITEDKLWHVPVVIIVPSVYAGYQVYQHRKEAARFLQMNL